MFLFFFFSPLYHSESDITLERDESAEKMSEETEADSQSDGRENESELSFFPNENKEDFIFQKTLTAVQSWFTLFGWSKGPNPVSIPHSLRR